MRTIIPLALLLGCVVVQPPQPPQPPGSATQQPTAADKATANIVVTADVRKLNTKKVDVLVPEQVLVEGDEVALNVELDHDAYVYVMYVDARGTISDLFPATGETIVHSGSQRLPFRNWWRLDAAKGMESFVVLAAATPLDSSVRRSRAAIQKPATGKKSPASHARPPIDKGPTPPVRPRQKTGITEWDRGVFEVVDGNRIIANPDDVGVTTAVLTINHR